VHQFGFIIRIYHDARSPELKIHTQFHIVIVTTPVCKNTSQAIRAKMPTFSLMPAGLLLIRTSQLVCFTHFHSASHPLITTVC